VRSRKLSNVDQSLDGLNLLSRTPPCFGRHVKPLVLAAFAVVNPPRELTTGWWVLTTTNAAGTNCLRYVCNIYIRFMVSMVQALLNLRLDGASKISLG
jgi:hypothetical protein